MITDPLVERLVKQRDSAENQIASLKQLAVDGERNLTDSELEAVDTYKRSIADIDKQLAAVGDDLRMSDTARQNLSMLSPSIQAPTAYRSAGELIYDILHGDKPEAAQRLKGAYKRAAEHMGTDKSTTVATAGDLLGLAVVPTIGPIVQPVPRRHPVPERHRLAGRPGRRRRFHPPLLRRHEPRHVGHSCKATRRPSSLRLRSRSTPTR